MCCDWKAFPDQSDAVSSNHTLNNINKSVFNNNSRYIDDQSIKIIVNKLF